MSNSNNIQQSEDPVRISVDADTELRPLQSESWWGRRMAMLKKTPFSSFLCVLFVAALGEASRGMVIPSLWPYVRQVGGDEEHLGWVSASFSISRFIAAPLFGWLAAKRSHYFVMFLALILLIVGNTIFVVADSPMALVISRLVVGFGAGTLGQARGYVADTTTKEKRTKYMSWMTLAQYAAFSVTPGLGALFAFIEWDFFGDDEAEVDACNAAGYALVILSVLCMALLVFFFREPPKSEAIRKVSVVIEPTPETGTWGKVKAWFSNTFDYSTNIVLIFCLFAFLNLITRGSVSVLETTNVATTSHYFGWSMITNSLVLCAVGFVGMFVLILLPKVCKKFGEDKTLLVGIVILGSSFLFLMPWDGGDAGVGYMIRYIIGTVMAWSFGFGVCQALVLTMLSKALGPTPQGAIMGWMSSLGSIARILGSLWGGLSLSISNENLTYGFVAVTLVVCAIIYGGFTYVKCCVPEEAEEERYYHQMPENNK